MILRSSWQAPTKPLANECSDHKPFVSLLGWDTYGHLVHYCPHAPRLK